MRFEDAPSKGHERFHLHVGMLAGDVCAACASCATEGPGVSRCAVVIPDVGPHRSRCASRVMIRWRIGVGKTSKPPLLYARAEEVLESRSLPHAHPTYDSVYIVEHSPASSDFDEKHINTKNVFLDEQSQCTSSRLSRPEREHWISSAL